MASLVRLFLVLGFASAWILAAAIVTLCWWRRAHNAKRIKGNDAEHRAWVDTLRRPAQRHAGVEWAIVITGIGFAGCLAWGLIEPRTIEVTYHQIRSPS